MPAVSEGSILRRTWSGSGESRRGMGHHPQHHPPSAQGGVQSRPDPGHQGALGLSSPRGKGAGVCPPTREFLVTGCRGAGGSAQLSVRTRWAQCHLLRARGQPPGTGLAEARGGMYRAGEEIEEICMTLNVLTCALRAFPSQPAGTRTHSLAREQS